MIEIEKKDAMKHQAKYRPQAGKPYPLGATLENGGVNFAFIPQMRQGLSCICTIQGTCIPVQWKCWNAQGRSGMYSYPGWTRYNAMANGFGDRMNLRTVPDSIPTNFSLTPMQKPFPEGSNGTMRYLAM